MQLAYRIPLNRAQAGTRAAKWINPEKNELLIPDRETAFAQIRALEKQLKGVGKTSMPRFKRAEVLIARAMIFEALGTPLMLEAAQDAWRATKTAITAHLMAVAYHHLGNLKTACSYYEQAYRYPHEPGFNIDLAYTQALLFQGKWAEAHKMTLGLKKRMVYAAYLPEWDMRSKEVSIISEGGFGDIIHTGRWLPIIREMGVRATVYLPPYFFEHGFVDLCRRQPWCPEIKLLTETPQNVPAVGFFDLPAKFDVRPDTIPPSLTFEPDPERVKKFKHILENEHKRPLVGICWAARAMETPLVPSGVYRSLTQEQIVRIIQQTSDKAHFVNLQFGEQIEGAQSLEIKSWEDTAAIIANLDAVVTVDTAVFHLAAAMGKPVYLLLSGASDWKFGLDDATCRWYPTVKIFRNNAFGFDTAVESLIEFLNAKFHGPTIGHCSQRQKPS